MLENEEVFTISNRSEKRKNESFFCFPLSPGLGVQFSKTSLTIKSPGRDDLQNFGGFNVFFNQKKSKRGHDWLSPIL